MKKYEGDKKKYMGNMKIRPLLIYGTWDLERFRDHPFFSGGGGGGFAISRFRGTPEKRHETCQKNSTESDQCMKRYLERSVLLSYE